MKRLLFLCATLASLVGISCKGVASNPKTTLKVMSSNIRFNSDKDLGDTSWDARKGPYSAMIGDIRPDVIGMQEPRDAQYADLEKLLPEYDRFRILPDKQISRKQASSGMILWRKEKFLLLETGYFWLGPIPDKPCMPWDATDKYHYRMAIWVKLQEIASGKEFYFFSTHLPYDPANRPDCFDAAGNRIRNIVQRTKCAELIVGRMRQIAGKKATVFLVGDMNCPEDKADPTAASLAPFRKWMRSGRKAAPETDTVSSFNGFSPTTKPWSIDHIFFRHAVPRQFRTIDSPNYGVRYLSDHHPILLTVEF